MSVIIKKPSEKFKKKFDMAAIKVAREVHQLMKEKQIESEKKEESTEQIVSDTQSQSQSLIIQK